VGGWVGIAFVRGWNRFEHFLEPVFADASHLEVFEHHGHHPSLGLEIGLGGVSLVIGGLGIGLALLCYRQRPALATRLRELAGPLYTLLLNKYYIDELYDRLFVRPLHWLADVSFRFMDMIVVDGTVNGVGRILRQLGRSLRPVQSGYVRAYAMVFAIGVVVILGLMIR
jgi:NADH-quinone oxidoreductase subunit L